MEGYRTDESREEWKVAGRIRRVYRKMEGCRTDKKSLEKNGRLQNG